MIVKKNVFDLVKSSNFCTVCYLFLISFFSFCANETKPKVIAITALSFDSTCPINLSSGSSKIISVTQTPSNATAAFNISIDQPPNDKKITMSIPSELSNGKSTFTIHAKKKGTATIKATSGSIQAECKVTVP